MRKRIPVSGTTGGERRSPLLGKGGDAAPSSKWSRSFGGAAGVVRSTSDNRWLEPTTPSAPAKEASRHFLNGRSHRSLSKEGTSALSSVVFNARVQQNKPFARRGIRFATSPYPPLHVELEDFFRVVFEDHFLFGCAQPLETFDDVPRFVQPLSSFGILDGADAWSFCAEQTAIGAYRFEEQGKSLCRVQHGVVIQMTHLVREARISAPQGAGFKAGELIGNRSAAMGNKDLECRKIREHIRIQQ